MVSVLASGHKVRGVKLGRGSGFLGAIKISSTPSFGWEVKQMAQCRYTLRRVKNHLK
jgi:hypothetical protein